MHSTYAFFDKCFQCVFETIAQSNTFVMLNKRNGGFENKYKLFYNLIKLNFNFV